MSEKSAYKRVLLKLSGQALTTQGQPIGIEEEACLDIAKTIQNTLKLNIELAIVLGGGNFIRGHTLSSKLNMDRTEADHVGMYATLMNGMILHHALKKVGVKSIVLSSFECSFVEKYNYQAAQSYLSQGLVVIFVGGTGSTHFTTDTAAALKACEIKAEVILKATKVDGVYDKDPKKHSDAKMYNQLSYSEVLEKNLGVMDATAISLCREFNVPIIVFNMYKPENLKNAICKKSIGTKVLGDQ